MKQETSGGPVVCRDNQTAVIVENEVETTIPPARKACNSIQDPLAALVFEVGYRAIQRDRYAFIAPGIPVRTGTRKRGER